MARARTTEARRRRRAPRAEERRAAATYKDANILHGWSFNYDKGTGSYVGGSESKEAYSKLGIDLLLEADKKYTVELGATSSKLTPDP